MRKFLTSMVLLACATLSPAARGDEAKAAACEGEALAQHLASLFLPSPPAARLVSARALSVCPSGVVQGPLAAALRTESEPLIRAAITEALGAMPASTFVRMALAQARRDPDPFVRGKAEQAYQGAIAAAQAEAARARLERAAEARAAVPHAPADQAAAANVASQPAPPAPTLSMPPLAPVPSRPPPLRLLPPAPLASSGPPAPTSGVPLLLTTSLLAGGTWGAGLAVMADQRSPGVMMLLGSAGAIIGGGTAFALSRFGVRPRVEQALWFTNATAWGGLAGLMAYAGSGANDSRLQAGLLVGGESLGVALGAWSASRWQWKPAQTAVADGLVLGSALTVMGLGRWDGQSSGVPAWMGYGTAPVMLASAVAAQHLSLSRADLRFIAFTSASSSLTLGLLGSGLAGTSSFGSAQGQGGLLAGLGMGVVASTLASHWLEPTSKQLGLATAGWLSGAAFGLGSFMVAFPDEGEAQHQNLGAALGAATFAAAGYWLSPHVHAGSDVVPWTIAGAAWSAGLWTLSSSIYGGLLSPRQQGGGALALAVGGGLAGVWASNHHHPKPSDYASAFVASLAGASGGLGVSLLASSGEHARFAGMLTGGAAGLALGAWANHHRSTNAAEGLAAAAGGIYGVLIGASVRNFLHDEAQNDRLQAGAQALGLSLGVLGGAAAARLAHANAGQVFVPTVAMGLGMMMGAGAGDLAAGAQGRRIGATTAGLSLATASLLLDQRLHLSQGLGRSWLEAAVWGGALGGFQGLLLAHWADNAFADEPRDIAPGSGFLAGAAAGVATGLVLSKFGRPSAVDYVFTASGSLVGLSLGAGLAGLYDPKNATAGSALRFGGSLIGLLSAATLAHAIKPTDLDLVAEGLGAGYGFTLGALVTTLDGPHERWQSAQTTGATLGLGLGAMGAVAARHALHATDAQVATTTVGTTLATMAGLGLGMAFPGDSARPARIGATLGLTLGLAGTLAADRGMRLSHTPFAPRLSLALAGAGLGGYQGLWLGQALSSGEQDADVRSRQRGGSFMFGTAAGAITGVLLSESLRPGGVDLVITGAGSALGSALGAGAARVLTSQAGAQDAWSTLAGSMTGLVATGLLQRHAPLNGADAAASGLGLSLGALAGSLAPSLHLANVTTSDRLNQGGLLMGAAAGTALGVATRKATHAQVRTVAMAAWGGLHGTVTGLGVGGLVDSGSEATQGQRIGALAGGLGGTALGALAWKKLSLSNDPDRHTVVAASLWGGWSGWWASRLISPQEGESEAVSGLIAGAGVGSMLALSAAPHVAVSDDLLIDALTMSALFGGAGGGAAALVSTRSEAVPAAVLIGSGAGALLGSFGHANLHIRAESAPLLALATAQGAFAGSLLPGLLYGDDSTLRQRQGALAAATLGGAAVGVLLTAGVKPTASTSALAAVGGATGAAVGGGAALVADGLGPQTGAGLTLLGSALGLTAGAFAGRYQPSASGVFKASAVGAAFGAAEGAVFAWAARGTSRSDYQGSMLIGAGLGTTLALASVSFDTWQIPASAGFGAWGAWVGAFAGALYQPNPQEVTLGGLLGLHVGAAAGYGALSAGWVEPGDFGWLSLFGAAGTLAGGGAGALFSSTDNPRPAYVGLAVGPLVGLGVGALMLPTWRRLRGPENQGSRAGHAPSTLADQVAAVEGAPAPSGPVGLWAQGAKRKLSNLIAVEDVMPLVGAMPSDPQSGTPPPFVFGLSGKLR